MATPDRHERVPRGLRPLTRWAGFALRDVELALRNAFARPYPTPVFVLGNQKSGTSIVATLLGRLSNLGVTIDLRREIRRPTFQRVVRGEASFESFLKANRADFARPIVKEPNLTHFPEALAARFPEARFAWVVRDPRDNLRSILNRLRLPGDLARLEAQHSKTISPAWRLVLDGRWWGLEGAHYIDQLAERWNRFADVHRQRNVRVELIRYEDFLQDKVGSIERLATALGLEARADISTHVDQQIQARGDRSAGWSEFFGERNLERIEQRCGERLLELGYPPGCKS